MTLSTSGRTASAKPTSKLPTLTGMRFIAAIVVFLAHIVQASGLFAPAVANTMNTVVGRGGFVGVGFFFILSGFVLTWSARAGDTVPRFWRRRLLKIFPNHLVTLCAGIVLLIAVSHQAVSLGDAGLNMALMQTWVPDPAAIIGNPVAWSLSCELVFYLSFPYLARLLGKIRPERLLAWSAGVVAAMVAIAALATALPAAPDMPFTGVTATEWWFLLVFPPVRMLDFVLGILLARFVLSGRRPPLDLRTSAALAVAMYVVTAFLPTTYHLSAVMAAPLGLVIAAGAAADVAGQSTGLSNRPMVWLGDVSFAFYMVHFLVLFYLPQWITGGAPVGTPAALVLALLLFGTTLVLSWALFALVERPVMRRFGTPRRRIVPTPPAKRATPADGDGAG